MLLKDLYNKGILKKHETSQQEITSLFQIIDRDIKDTSQNISDDWKFGIAYNAALKLCTILIYASGYRVAKGSHHMYSISLIPIILGNNRKSDADYLDSCRRKRNIVEYDQIDGVTEDEVSELISFVAEFKKEVINWLSINHPNLLNKHQ